MAQRRLAAQPIASAACRSLRHVFLQQWLENNEDDERQKKHQQQPLLRAGFLLRIFKVGQI